MQKFPCVTQTSVIFRLHLHTSASAYLILQQTTFLAAKSRSGGARLLERRERGGAGGAAVHVCVRVKVSRRRHFLVIACACAAAAAPEPGATLRDALAILETRTARAAFRSHRTSRPAHYCPRLRKDMEWKNSLHKYQWPVQSCDNKINRRLRYLFRLNKNLR